METSQLDKTFLHSPLSISSAWKFAHNSPFSS